MKAAEITTSGTAPFMGVDFDLMPGVLVPREETELLGRTSVEILQRRPRPRRAIDMCCGSGNLACAVATIVDDLEVWASDLTDSCVALTRHNVERLRLTDRVHVRQGDLFSSIDRAELADGVDLVMCNPPYISTTRLEGDRSHLLASEPREAFDGGPYGLSIHQRVMREALAYLKPGAWIAFEFGEGQERQLGALLKRAGGYEPPQFIANADGVPRVMVAARLS
jgi:HemK-like putative methylase